MEPTLLIIIGLLLFIAFGGGWLRLYWYTIDPWLRRRLGAAMGVTIHRDQSSNWVIEGPHMESWRGCLLAPLNMVVLLIGGMLPLLVMIIVIISITRA
jgi:hypothetical protein